MIDQDTLIEIVQKAQNQTEQGLIKWKFTEHTKDQSLKVNFSRSSIFLIKRLELIDPSSGDFESFYTLEVANSQGTIVGKIQSEEVLGLEKLKGEDIVKKLYETAIKKTLEIDETVKDIIDSLDVPF